MKLAEIGEEQLLARLLPRLARNASVISGAGEDDCAVVAAPKSGRRLLLKTDCVVEGVHFACDANAAAVGWKAMARPLSDFAAMSGVPQFALVTVVARPDHEIAWMTKLYRGLERCASRFAVSIVGGETSSTSGAAVVSVSVSGYVEAEHCVTRSGGKAGDALFVTGRLGGSIRGRHLRFVPRIEEARWLTRHFRVHAMMDLSDGLGADLPRLSRASNVAFEIDLAAIPKNRGCTTRQAVADGEDYELLFAVAAKDAATLQRQWRKRWSLELTRIGRLTAGALRKQQLPAGYGHFG
jgi:thiamine-monophosphate kinase